jgi:hypothetical protein
MLLQKAFDLEFLAPDAGSFVPVYLSRMDRAIAQPDMSDTLAFAPATAPIDALKPGTLPNSGSLKRKSQYRKFRSQSRSALLIVSAPS